MDEDLKLTDFIQQASNWRFGWTENDTVSSGEGKIILHHIKLVDILFTSCV